MTTSELVSAAYLAATGKLPTFTSGTTKWNKIVAIANGKITAWQNEKDTDWNSLYDPFYSLGTVSATNTYDVDDEIRRISSTPGDFITIANLDGTTSNFETVEATRLKDYPHKNVCAQVGRTLVFSHTFTSTDKEFGGAITAPVYLYASLLTSDNSEVPVDDPRWLALITAAEYVRTDITNQNQYPNLIAEANALMENMRAANEAQLDEVNRPWQPMAMNW